MKLETAIEQLVELVYGPDMHQDKVKFITDAMSKINGGSKTIPDAKLKQLLKPGEKLKSMGMQ